MVRRSGRKVQPTSSRTGPPESILHARVGALVAMAPRANDSQVGQSSDDEGPAPEELSEYDSEESEYQDESEESEEDEKVETMTSDSSGFFEQSPQQYAELLAAGVVTNGESVFPPVDLLLPPLMFSTTRIIMPAPHHHKSHPHHPGFIDDLYSKEIPPIGAELNLLQDADPQENVFFNEQGMAGINPDIYGMGMQGGSWDEFLFEQVPPQAALSIDDFDTQGNFIAPNSQNQAFRQNYHSDIFPGTFNPNNQFAGNDLGINYGATLDDNLDINYEATFLDNLGINYNDATFNNNLGFDYGAPLDENLGIDYNSILNYNAGLGIQEDLLNLNSNMQEGTDELQHDVTAGVLNNNQGNVSAVLDNGLQAVDGIGNKFTDDQTFNPVDHSVPVVNDFAGATNSIHQDVNAIDDFGSEFDDVDNFTQQHDAVDTSRGSSPIFDQPIDTAVGLDNSQRVIASDTKVVPYNESNNQNDDTAIVPSQQVNTGMSEWEFVTATQRRVKDLVDAKGCNITHLMMHILHHGTLTFGPTHSNDLVSFVMGRNMCTRAKDIGQNTEPQVPDYVVTWFNSLCEKIAESTWEPHLGQFVHPSVPVIHGNPYIDTAPFEVQAALGGLKGRNVDANGQPIRPMSVMDRSGQPKLSSGKFPADINQRGDQNIVSIRHTVYGNPPPREPRLKKIDYNINPYIVVVGGTHETSLAYDIWPNETKELHRCSVCEFKDTSPKTMQRHIVDHRGWIQCPWNNVTGAHACQTGEMPVAPRLFCRWDKFEEHVNERHPTVGPKFTEKMHPTMFAIYVRHLFRGAQPQPGKLRSSRGRIVADVAEADDDSSAADTSAGDITMSTDAGDTTGDITDNSIIPESPVASGTPASGTPATKGRKPAAPKAPRTPRATKPRTPAKSRAKPGPKGKNAEVSVGESTTTQDSDTSMVESEVGDVSNVTDASVASNVSTSNKRKHQHDDDETDDVNNKKVRAA
ncbi:hypothetical protein FPQ18DRAFT_412344 [Pyronema domesticum]|nr:hypothetical protein FPQ18DRAFT_412344 [Pyronema domesticum]